MRTFELGDYRVYYNGDGSGDAEIRVMVPGTEQTSRRFEVPCEVLVGFVAELVREQRVAEVLGLAAVPMPTSRRVLPPDHEQAGMPYPRVGQFIETAAWGESGDDWALVKVVALSEDGDPIVTRPGGYTLMLLLSDPLTWSWPEAASPRGGT